MKLIIDIPDKKYEWIKEDTLCYTDEISEAIRQGIPLENIKAKIETEENKLNVEGELYYSKSEIEIFDKCLEILKGEE